MEATGIPTSGTFSEFQVTVDEIFDDKFNGFSMGVLQVLDNFDSDFDGIKKSFRLVINELPLSIQSAPGSPIEVDKTLIIFINDVLQQPEVAYNFTGGGTVEFVETLKEVIVQKYYSTRVVVISMLSSLTFLKLSRLVTNWISTTTQLVGQGIT